MAQEGHAGFEVAGEFGTLEIGGFWSGHTPKTPPFVVPVRDRSHVQGFPVQHSLNLKMSGTQVYVNTLMMQQVLSEPEWQDQLTPADLRALTPLKWQHINPYGTFTLNMAERLPIESPEIS